MDFQKFHIRKEEMLRNFMRKNVKPKDHNNNTEMGDKSKVNPNTKNNQLYPNVGDKEKSSFQISSKGNNKPTRRSLSVVNNEMLSMDNAKPSSSFTWAFPGLKNRNKKNEIRSEVEDYNLYSMKRTSTKKISLGCIDIYSSSSIAGESPFHITKQNQDELFEILNHQGVIGDCVFAVLDGHGYQGQLVAKFLKEKFQKSIRSELLVGFDVTSITTIFDKVNTELLKNSNIDCSMSGSTCVMLFLSKTHIILANVGDSRAILGSCNSDMKWKAKPLSIDHKPSRPDENQRIIENGGKVEPLINENGVESGPDRVWKVSGMIPGLAMSRSMGDTVAASVGVTAEPEFIEHDIALNDKLIILASDGVWEFISNEEALEIVSNYYEAKDPKAACEALIKESLARWLQSEGISDDITCTIIFLK